MTEPGDRAGRPGSLLALGLTFLIAACSAEPPPAVVTAPPRATSILLAGDAGPPPEPTATFDRLRVAEHPPGARPPSAHPVSALERAADARQQGRARGCARGPDARPRAQDARGGNAEPDELAGLAHDLAAKRAQAIRDWFVARGIAASPIDVISNDAKRAAENRGGGNRRVDLRGVESATHREDDPRDAGSPDAGLPTAADAGAAGWWCAEAHTPTCKSYCVRGERACLDAIRRADGEPFVPTGLGACFAVERA
jgi:hypothetical protein